MLLDKSHSRFISWREMDLCEYSNGGAVFPLIDLHYLLFWTCASGTEVN